MIEGIYIMGILQGIILSLILFFHKKFNSSANRSLGHLVLTVSAWILGQFLLESGFHTTLAFLFLLLTSTPFLIGPLLYLYVKKVVSNSFLRPKKNYLHFIPAILYTLFLIGFVHLSFEGDFTLFIERSTQVPELGSASYSPIALAKAGHLLIYTYLSISLIIKKRISVKNGLSILVLSYAGIQVVFWIFMISKSLLSDSILSTLQVVNLYLIGYQGLLNPVFFFGKKEKYRSTNLHADEVEVHYQRLLELMHDEKPYLDAQLSLKQLASFLKLNENQLSQIINQHGLSFSDFVNKHRVEEVKQMLAQAKYQHLKLLAIAFEAGFNNKNSFNNHFKKETGLTPSDYRDSLRI